jgi:hypothetical protein
MMGLSSRTFHACSLLALGACSSTSGAPGTSASPEGGGTPEAVTYFRDVKPILDAKCAQCHFAGGIAPFALTSFDDAVSQKDAMVAATASRVMPPWPPGPDCTDYVGNRSLSDAQIKTLSDWVGAGAAAGNAADYVPLAGGSPGLSRVDRTLMLAEPYTPVLRPDEYRCFLLDWSNTADAFITGFGTEPGNAAIVHHVLAYAVAPADVATYQGYDDADPAPGYSCFGGPNATGSKATDVPAMIGGWAPGTPGSDFPAGTGIRIAPGSKIVVQIHYNTLSAPPAPDQSAIHVKIDTAVDKEAFVLPFANPSWVQKHTMLIAANAPDATYSYTLNANLLATRRSGGAIAPAAPFNLYSAGLHMHLHGTHANVSLESADGAAGCLLDIPHWNFHWQGSYEFGAPQSVAATDVLRIECHWDNTAANQPVVNGATMPPEDLNWGEGTADEMCIAFLYATQ